MRYMYTTVSMKHLYNVRVDRDRPNATNVQESKINEIER